MLADRNQKELQLKYVVSRRWLPQLELDISSYVTTGKSPLSITDVDVFGAIPDESRGFRNIVIDCKTKKGESPINRALWQRGLMERVGRIEASVYYAQGASRQIIGIPQLVWVLRCSPRMSSRCM